MTVPGSTGYPRWGWGGRGGGVGGEFLDPQGILGGNGTVGVGQWEWEVTVPGSMGYPRWGGAVGGGR